VTGLEDSRSREEARGLEEGIIFTEELGEGLWSGGLGVRLGGGEGLTDPVAELDGLGLTDPVTELDGLGLTDPVIELDGLGLTDSVCLSKRERLTEELGLGLISYTRVEMVLVGVQEDPVGPQSEF
jgi:hypothetical protein